MENHRSRWQYGGGGAEWGTGVFGASTRPPTAVVIGSVGAAGLPRWGETGFRRRQEGKVMVVLSSVRGIL